MNLIFERGNRDAPVGHALIFFRTEDNSIVATYVGVLPIPFDLTSYMPPVMASAMQGMGDLSDAMVATPIPPIPQKVAGIEYLRALAARRQDDLVFAGGTMGSDPGRLMADAGEAAREYGELYSAASPADEGDQSSNADAEMDVFAEMGEREQLNELTALIGRLRDSLRFGPADADVERQIRRLGSILPAKYRGPDIVEAALIPGDRGQHLTELYLERSFKLYNEDYLDLQRIDREIEAARE